MPIMTAATIPEMAKSSGHEPDEFLAFVLEIIPPERKAEFIQGLSQRIADASENPNDETALEITRWLGAWYLSARLVGDRGFEAADDEASKLIVSGQLGDGLTAARLRDRYRTS